MCKRYFYHSGKTLNVQNLLISPHNDGTCGAVVSTGSDWVVGSNPALGVCPCAVSMCQGVSPPDIAAHWSNSVSERLGLRP